MTTRMHATPNENTLKAAPTYIDATLRIDMNTWRFFENLDEDSRAMMSRVLKDYVEKQD